MLKKSMFVVLSVSGLLLVGCGESEPKTPAVTAPKIDTKKVDDAAKKTGDALKDAAKEGEKKIEEGAKKVEETVKDGAQDVTKKVEDMGK